MFRTLSNGTTEIYSKIIEGACKCGTPIIKVLGSNRTMWVSGERFHYPNDLTPSCIFRCGSCKEPIHLNFIEKSNTVKL